MAASTKNVYQRLLAVQTGLVAPRQAGGKFGKARSAEQVLESLKPLLKEHSLLLHTTDVIHEVNGRNYVTTTARVYNVDDPTQMIDADASAWENEVELNKFGAPILDTSQVTGKTTSYAKKYALQNLFNIDDTQDADHDAPMDDTKPAQRRPSPNMANMQEQKRQMEEARTLDDTAQIMANEIADDHTKPVTISRIKALCKSLGLDIVARDNVLAKVGSESEGQKMIAALEQKLDDKKEGSQ